MWKERAVSNASTFAVATKGDSLYCQMSSTDEFESSVPAAEPVAEGRKRVAAVSASRSLVVGAAVVTMVTCCRRSKASIARSELVDVLGAVAGRHRRYCWQTRRWLALSAPRLGGRGDELWSNRATRACAQKSATLLHLMRHVFRARGGAAAACGGRGSTAAVQAVL